MVGMMAAGMVGVVRVLVVVWVPVWCSGVQGCKGTMTGKAYLCTSFVVVCYWGNRLFLYLCGLVPFRGWWRPCGLVGWWWWVGGVVVPVVGRDWQAVPPSSSV